MLKPGIDGLISELCGTYMYKAPEQLIGSVYSKVSFDLTFSLWIFGHVDLSLLKCSRRQGLSETLPKCQRRNTSHCLKIELLKVFLIYLLVLKTA